jgi:mono/diheme cytochrome c family protein
MKVGLACFGMACVGASLVALGHLSAQAQVGERSLGEQIAQRECVGCHGIGSAKGVTIQGVFVPSFSEIARRPNQTRERVQAFLTIPRHPMPGLPLGNQELRHLAEYILSLRD